jgi:hypothetical protein
MFITILIRLAKLRRRWLSQRYNFIEWRLLVLDRRKERVAVRHNRINTWISDMEKKQLPETTNAGGTK